MRTPEQIAEQLAETIRHVYARPSMYARLTILKPRFGISTGHGPSFTRLNNSFATHISASF